MIVKIMQNTSPCSINMLMILHVHAWQLLWIAYLRLIAGSVPGWTDEVEPMRQTCIFWHNLWVSCGRPHDGVVADIMRRTRATYHYTVRSVKRREQDIVNQQFATALLSHKDRDF